MRTLENSSSSEEEDRADLLGRNFQVPRPKSRSNGSIAVGLTLKSKSASLSIFFFFRLAEPVGHLLRCGLRTLGQWHWQLQCGSSVWIAESVGHTFVGQQSYTRATGYTHEHLHLGSCAQRLLHEVRTLCPPRTALSDCHALPPASLVIRRACKYI